MFKYTRATINKTIAEFKLFSRIFKYLYIILNFIYLTYKLITDNSNFIFYIVLLSIFIVYATFSILIDFDKRFKKAKRISRRIFKITNIFFKMIIIVTNILCIYKASSNFTAMTIILLLLTILLWIMQVTIEIFIYVFESKKDLLIDAIKEDFKGIVKPVSSVSNFIKKIKGEDIDEKEESNSIEILDAYLKRRANRDNKNKDKH